MREPRWFYVYMMQSSSRRALYIGVCSKLERRVWQHKHDVFGGFTDEYHAHRLVYFERFGDIRNAIEREKQLKGWTRAKKNALIRQMNPGWRDLSEGWYEKHPFQPDVKQPQDPSARAPSQRLGRARSG